MNHTARRRRSMRAIRCTLAMLGATLAIIQAVQPQKGREGNERNTSKEYALKAQMIQKMISFVSWPKGMIVKGQTVFTIGVLGSDPFGKSLDAAFAKARPKGCTVRIVRLGNWAEMKDKRAVLACHAIFIAGSERKQLSRILARVRKAPIWLVADSPGFAKLGVHVNFYITKSKVRFETHANAARLLGLRMSSKLLRLGRSVR